VSAKVLPFVTRDQYRAAAIASVVEAPPAVGEVEVLDEVSPPMRQMTQMVCRQCGGSWQQPATMGACPSCHSHYTYPAFVRHSELPRV